MADKVFGPFYDALKAPQIPNLEITEHSQHYELRDKCEMVNGLKGRWPSVLPHGQYVETWPGQIAEMSTEPKPIAVPVRKDQPTLTKEEEQVGVNFLKPTMEACTHKLLATLPPMPSPASICV